MVFHSYRLFQVGQICAKLVKKAVFNCKYAQIYLAKYIQIAQNLVVNLWITCDVIHKNTQVIHRNVELSEKCDLFYSPSAEGNLEGII